MPFLVKSQDIHFSNNGIIPTFINPANTGAFLGSIRASSVYRDQFSSFIENPYRSVIVSVDSPVAFGFKENHWVGVGLQLYNDRAGDVALVRNGYGLGAAYHIGLDNDFRSVVTLGLNYGNIKSNLDEGSARFGNQAAELVNLSNYGNTQSNISVGVRFKTEFGKSSIFEAGFSTQRVTTSRAIRDTLNGLERRMNFTALLNTQLSKKIRLTPEFYFSKSSNFTNTSLHIFPEFAFGNKNNFLFRPGVGMRFGDAMIMHLGGMYKGWRVNLSYDMTVSSASVYNNNNGGFEIGVQRIFTIYKKPKKKLKLICPRL